MSGAEDSITCWRSKNNGPWHQITVGIHSPELMAEWEAP